MMNLRKSLVLMGVTVASAALSGCSDIIRTDTASVSGSAIQGSVIQGSVFGGSQPIGNATIQLYAAGNTGYGSAYTYTAGSSLLGTNTVTSLANGTFSIAGDFTCPSAATPVYLVATGGSPGLANNGTNPHIALMAALGPCGGLNQSTHITVNEMSTVGSVWALAPFMTGIANIGTSAGNSVGLTNAFATVNKLVNTATGNVSGPALPSNATLPVAKINTLANILAACVNSPGNTTACSNLFKYTTVNGVVPNDTLTAAMNLAQHPNLQTSNLWGLVTTSGPFQPALPAAPSDFSLVLTYTGGGLSNPKGIAVDPSGSVWTANYGNSSVSEFSNTGAAISSGTGYTVGSLNLPFAIAMDPSGNAWVANSGNSSVTKVSSSGLSGTVYSGGGLSSPKSVAVDGSSNVWVANGGNANATVITSGGTLASYPGTSGTSSSAIAITPK
jgi:hypothetical protein